MPVKIKYFLKKEFFMKKITQLVTFFLMLTAVPLFAQEQKMRINGARVFGVRPDHPILFKVPVSGGELPLTFSLAGFPDNVTIDTSTGIISGSVTTPGTYSMDVQVTDAAGAQISRKWDLVVGEEISLTPPMGWNSWYSWSESVSHEKIIETAKAMVSSGLINYGWTYINIDDCWQGTRVAKGTTPHTIDGALQGNDRFPDMKALTDEIHALGLKAGIYSTPWIGTYAGFRGSSSDFEDGGDSPNTLAPNLRYQENQIYGRYPGLHSRRVDRFGKYSFSHIDIKQWATWGFDYLKLDWNPNDVPTTKRYYEELRKSGRDIILSLSNTAPIEDAEGLAKWSNLWRTTGDIHDSWYSISHIMNSQDKWRPFMSPGHWNDPDMLQVGSFGTPNTLIKKPVPTRLTYDEQKTQLSFWGINSAPLLLSCDLTVLDQPTIDLLTNSDLIDINQDPLGLPPTTFKKTASHSILVKELYNGDKAVACFNHWGISKTINLNFSKIAGFSPASVLEVWSQEKYDSSPISLRIPKHGVALFLIKK